MHPSATQVEASPAAPVIATGADAEKRDWVAWYEGLDDCECREIRNRLVLASPDDVREDAELRHFFLFHVDDLAHDAPPGTRRLQEFFHVVMTLRGREELAGERRKAVAFLLAEYQNYLRDNPFAL